MKDAIAKQKDEFIKNKYLIDCRSIGAGVMITGKDLEIGSEYVKFDDYIQDLCNYDLVVLAHGGDSKYSQAGRANMIKRVKELLKKNGVENTSKYDLLNKKALDAAKQGQEYKFTDEEQKYVDKVTELIGQNADFVQGDFGKSTKADRWEFSYPITFVDGKRYSNVVNFIKAAKKQGFKKIKLYSCNPGSYDLPADLKPGVVFSKRTNYVENTIVQDYDVAENPYLEGVFQLEELALELCEENNIDYTDDIYLNECMTYYEDNKNVLTEGKLATVFHKLVEFCGKIIGAIVGFIKMIVKGVSSLITKIANFLKNKDQRKMSNKSVEVKSITLEAAKLKTTKVSSQDELYKVIESDLNKIAKEYRKVAEKQARINKELQNQLKQVANKEEANESSVINAGTNFTDRILNELYGEPEAKSVVVQEGLIKRIRELLSKKTRKQKNTSDIAKEGEWKKAPEGEKESSNPLLTMKTPYTRKEVSGKSYLDKFYKNNDFCIECAPKDPKFPQILANILYLNYDINTPVEVYVVSCEDINKFYDLAGDNAYREEAIFVIIPFDTLKDSNDTSSAKVALRARWFNDVVDNNEYREYMAGRHEKSKQIQWIIDARGGRD